ncbi:MAG: methionine adenosyltransferase [Candidatus Izemoplasmataceae bacterium]
MTHKRLFTSESVTEGHPDKICDQISDAILDAILKDDRNARVAVETAATTGLILVMGEITTTTYVDIQKIVRQTVKEIGYDRGKYGFDAENLGVLVAIDPQSPDIAQGVNKDDTIGAGDQGIMFGYATDETDEYMPITHMYAQKLALQLSKARKDKTIPSLRPDGKTQITIEFNEDGTPKRVDNIIVSSQHAPNIKQDALHAAIKKHVIEPVIPNHLIDHETRYYINPTGKFVVGGPHGDAGLTGRKVIVDTYGGVAHHGGGAFSGKDPSKVDRSASYMARYVAKNLVASGIAKEIELQIAYAIGVSEPTSIHVDTFGTSKYSDETIRKVVDAVFDLTPKGIIETLELDRPIYRQVAAYGHFGRSDLDLPWEQIDKVDAIQAALESLT